MGKLSNGPIADPQVPSNPKPGGGVEKSSLQISVNRMEVDENVEKWTRAPLNTYTCTCTYFYSRYMCMCLTALLTTKHISAEV